MAKIVQLLTLDVCLCDRNALNLKRTKIFYVLQDVRTFITCTTTTLSVSKTLTTPGISDLRTSLCLSMKYR